jgi:hypothetical protein
MRALRPEIVRQEEAHTRRRYPIRIATPAGEARFWRSRFYHEHYSDEPDAPKIKHRSSVGWLHAGGERVALMTLEEYDLDPGVYWEEFWLEADGLAVQNGNAVEAMRAYWGGSFVTPADYGPIVLCTGAWIAPHYRTRLDYRGAFDAILPSIAPNHGIAVLIAYPIDDHSEDPRPLGTWERRQRALMRFYERELGFIPMPPSEAQFGFMWRARTEAIAGALVAIAGE